MKRIVKTIYILTLVISIQTLLVTTALAQDWAQWGRDPQHTSQINVAGQNLNRNLADVIYDSTVPGEISAANQLFGEADLLVPYQGPLIDGNDVYREFNPGTQGKNTFAKITGPENKLRC